MLRAGTPMNTQRAHSAFIQLVSSAGDFRYLVDDDMAPMGRGQQKDTLS